MRSPLSVLKYVAAIGLGALIAFVYLGYAYLQAAHRWNPYYCVYGDAVCSLTVATYILGVVTALAFMAGLYVLGVAVSTFELERSTILSERYCGEVDHSPHVTVTLKEDLSVSLDEPDEGVRDLCYLPFDYDFDNLGRSPIVDAQVSFVCDLPGRKRVKKAVSLRGIKRDGHVHVRVFVWHSHIQLTIRWRDATKEELGKRVPLELRTSPQAPIEYLAAVPFTAYPDTVAAPFPKPAAPVQPKNLGENQA